MSTQWDAHTCTSVGTYTLIQCLISVGKELGGKMKSPLTHSTYPTLSLYVCVVCVSHIAVIKIVCIKALSQQGFCVTGMTFKFSLCISVCV